MAKKTPQNINNDSRASVKSTFGIVYVATQKASFIREAYHSAVSVKHFASHLPITLFTDQTNQTKYTQASCFDQVIFIDPNQNFKSSWACGQFDRLNCLSKSPYDITLHIDADTICLSEDITQLPSHLAGADIALTIANPEHSVSAKHYGQSMFYTGFMLYRRNDAVLKLFNEWHKLTKKLYNAATLDRLDSIEWLSHLKDPKIKARLSTMDRISFVQLLSPNKTFPNITTITLHDGWNYTGHYLPAVKDKVKIYSIRLPEKYLVQLNGLITQQDYKSFLDLADRILALFPWRLDVAFLKAQYYAQLRKDPEAVMQTLAGKLHWDPSHNAAHELLLAACLHKKNRAIMRKPYLDKMYAFLIKCLVKNKDAAPALLSRLGLLANRLGFSQQSVDFNRQVHLPTDEQSSVNLAIALIANRQSSEAAKILNNLPKSNKILSVLQIAHHEMGNMQAYHEIFNVDKGIYQTQLTLDWNDALTEYIVTHPSNQWQTSKHYAKTALHIGTLQDDNNELIKRFKKLLIHHLQNYLTAIEKREYFDLLINKPEKFQLKIRATTMQGQCTEQNSHTHPSGWCSGVYYCQLSENSSPQDFAGKLYFGPPPMTKLHTLKISLSTILLLRLAHCFSFHLIFGMALNHMMHQYQMIKEFVLPLILNLCPIYPRQQLHLVN